MSEPQTTDAPINFTIDGRPVQARPGWTVLDTARANGIYIPTLCHDPALPAYGSCRLCLVESRQGGRVRTVASCLYPPAEQMEIVTDSPRVLNARRWILEMLLAKCPSSPEVRRLAADQGVTSSRFRRRDETCTLCGLCVRACGQLGIQAIGFAGRGVDRRVTTPFDGRYEPCVECGTCVNACVHGHMRIEDEDGLRRIYLGDKLINEQPLVKCAKCGRYYATPAFLAYVKKKGDTPFGSRIDQELCPECYRQRRGELIARGGVVPT